IANPQPPASSPGAAHAVTEIQGRGLPLRGHDIDTDRIMPARFLVAVSFEGLEQHVFEDDRKADPRHPFNDARFRGAAVLAVNANFGCGSSREHAPQGLARAGIRAIIGESFSEIFQGNAAMLGMPCFSAAHADVERLQTLVEQSPDTTIVADVASGTITAGKPSFPPTPPPPPPGPLLPGHGNPTPPPPAHLPHDA